MEGYETSYFYQSEEETFPKVDCQTLIDEEIFANSYCSVKLTGSRVEEMYSAEIPQVSSEFSLSRVKMSEIPGV